MSLYVGQRTDHLSRRCPICNSSVAKRMCDISYVLPEGNPLPRKYDVVCCEKCGFAYANVDANQDIYNDYYAKYNMYSENAQLKMAGKRESVEKQVNLKMIKEMFSKDDAILDVGCGSGEMLNILKEEGFVNIWGMDPSAASIERLHQKGINGFVGNIFDNQPPEYTSTFDLVISTAVVEHIYDLHGYIRCIRKYLRTEKSCVMLDAPTVEGIDEYIWPLANHFNHEHINYFSKNSLDNLLRTEGFRPNSETIRWEDNHEKGITGLYIQMDLHEATDLQYDSLSREAIESYLLKYEKMDIEGSIELLLETKQNIVIWGGGSLAMQLLGNYPQLLKRTKYFIDNNSTKHGKVICGKEICSPQRLVYEEENIVILICSIKNTEEIRKQIMGMGLNKKKIITVGN